MLFSSTLFFCFSAASLISCTIDFAPRLFLSVCGPEPKRALCQHEVSLAPRPILFACAPWPLAR